MKWLDALARQGASYEVRRGEYASGGKKQNIPYVAYDRSVCGFCQIKMRYDMQLNTRLSFLTLFFPLLFKTKKEFTDWLIIHLQNLETRADSEIHIRLVKINILGWDQKETQES